MIADLLEFSFLRNAFLIGIMIGAVGPMLGVFLVVRRQALIADALSHITLAGIAGSLLLSKKIVTLSGLNPIYLGMVFSVFGSLFIERLRSVYKHFQELAIPIILSSGIGLSVLFISLADGFNTDLFTYLFGSIVAVGITDVWIVFVVLITVIIAFLLFYKEFFFLSFDEEQAKVSGISSKWIHLIFIVLVALVIGASMRIVGILLVSSLMTLPVAASIRIATGFKQAIILSILFGETSVIIGLVISYYMATPPGGTIVLTAVFILIFVLLFKKAKLQSSKLKGNE
jgi:zinc transport system permease protein